MTPPEKPATGTDQPGDTEDLEAQGSPPPETDEGPRAPEIGPWHTVVRSITTGSTVTSLLAVALAVVVGSVLIIATDEAVRETLGYITARPSDFFKVSWDAISTAYSALFRGSVYNGEVDGLQAQLRPLTETLKFAGPLIAAGLGVGLAFRAGMFNIGGRGQILLAGGAAAYVAVEVDLPGVLLLVAAIVAGAAAGALWAGLAGLLKARTGAHEVITTIMLNYVGYYLLFYALSRQFLLQAPGTVNPKSLTTPEDALLPDLLGDGFNLHAGFLLALASVAGVWWVLNRSSLGYRLRAVGANPHAARTAGIDVGRTYVVVMLLSGGLVGLAGVNQVLGTVPTGAGVDLDAGIGFDAITVALLGRSRPLGILAAGLLFGAFKAGSFAMRTEGISPDFVLVLQSLIVLFIAAPPLVRALFRLPAQEAK